MAPELAVALTALVVFCWRIGTPSPWWDEAVTRNVVTRPTEDLLALISSIDLVHAPYYLVVRAVLGPEPSFVAIRLVSALAAAATAAVLVRIGRELDSLAVGVTAGLLWTVAPLVTRYAQEARAYALVALLATVSTLLLLRAARRPWRAGRWAAYAASIVLLGLGNVLALMLLLVHVLHLATTAPGHVLRRWCGAAGGAVLLLAPWAVATSTQRGQVSWLPRPTPDRLLVFFDAQFTVGLVVLAFVVLAVATRRHGTSTAALRLGLGWAVIPPVLLWTVSQIHPLYDWRYVFFAVPGTALALGSLAPLLRPVGSALMIGGLLVAGLHMQHVYRLPATGHAEDVRGAAERVGTHAHAGDAVLFLPGSRRVVELGYPEQFTAVDDVALREDPTASATLFGREAPAGDLAALLRDRARVWVITGPARLGESGAPKEREKERLLARDYLLSWVDATKQYEVRLYVRRPVVVTTGGLQSATDPVTGTG